MWVGFYLSFFFFFNYSSDTTTVWGMIELKFGYSGLQMLFS